MLCSNYLRKTFSQSSTARKVLSSVSGRNAAGVRNLSNFRIGVIGLGNMGASMAKNLIKSTTLQKDHVMVYDINQSTAKSVAAEGEHGVHAESVEVIAEKCTVIITMLPATAHVEEVLLGKNADKNEGVLKNAKPGTIIIDSSTINPSNCQALHKKAAEHGCSMLDAPVSGGVTGAAAGTLTFMIGGDKEKMEQVRAVFEAMGSNLIHCGAPGGGEVAKLCNNMLLAISMIGTSEAMALGKKFGMDEHLLADILNRSTGRCWSSEIYNPVPGVCPTVPASNDYKGGFGVTLMNKDLGIASQLAEDVKAEIPFGKSATEFYTMLSNDPNYSTKDFAVAYQYLMNKGSGK